MRKITLSLAGGLVGAAVAVAGAAQVANMARPRTRAEVMQRNATLSLPEATPPMMEVQPLPEVLGATRDLHQRLAARLSRMQGVPAHRLNHFGWLNRPEFAVQGWHGFITKVQAIPGGYLVTLQVSPRVRSIHGAHTTVLDLIYETYAVTNGKVQLVDVVEPPGSGRMSYLTD